MRMTAAKYTFLTWTGSGLFRQLSSPLAQTSELDRTLEPPLSTMALMSTAAVKRPFADLSCSKEVIRVLSLWTATEELVVVLWSEKWISRKHCANELA